MAPCSRSLTIRKPSVARARTTRRLGASTGNLGMSLGDEGFQDRGFGFKNLGPECLEVKPNGGLAIGQRRVVSVAFSNHYALQPERVGHIAILVVFDDDLELFHGPNLSRELFLVKRPIRSLAA